MADLTRPPAVVLNLFYTGLGIARSLGRRGIRVIGLSAQRGVYGNYSRYTEVRTAPDSRKDPEALLAFLLRLGEEIGRGVLYPTRDDDAVFLDRFRHELEPYFSLVVPPGPVLAAALDKMETHRWAKTAGVPAPAAWFVEDEAGLERVMAEVTYPCVLKPLAAHHWRQGRNWELVGGRKAVKAHSDPEMRAEYATIARADRRVLIEEMIPGPDDSLFIMACYMDRNSNWVAGFNTQKLLQAPEEFGTGCIVQSVDRPELIEPTRRLLQAMGYTGIAEVEYKWHAERGEFQLIEINPRPWDQHRLGSSRGVDLMYTAYCEHAGLPIPAAQPPKGTCKWVAEDAFALAFFRLLWKRDPKAAHWLRLLSGKRIFAIWSIRDPLPSLIYMTTRFLPSLAALAVETLRTAWKARGLRSRAASGAEFYAKRLEK